MAEGSQPSKGKKNRKHGRNRDGEHKCGPAPRKYLARNTRYHNKLRRVLKYNGVKAAEEYEHKYGGQVHKSKSLVKVKTK
jgi:hypothetical protein